jgi:antitoxin component of MazEF toxin-antitoxin module
MKAQSTIGLSGQAAAVAIPPDVLKVCGLRVGQTVEVETSEDGMLIVRPVRAPNLNELLDKITPENLPDTADIEWGKPVGSEIW